MNFRASRSPLWPIAAAVVLAAFVKFFLIDLAMVEGPSMLPTFEAGQPVVVLRIAYGFRLPQGLGGYLIRWGNPEPGNVVIAENPKSKQPVIKRVAWTRLGSRMDGGLELWLLGDNGPDSLDSRSYGTVPVEDVAGRVLSLRPRP